MKKITQAQLAEFWANEYINDEGLCYFCLNRGKITKHYHQYRYCFCPNGRALKMEHEKR